MKLNIISIILSLVAIGLSSLALHKESRYRCMSGQIRGGLGPLGASMPPGSKAHLLIVQPDYGEGEGEEPE